MAGDEIGHMMLLLQEDVATDVPRKFLSYALRWANNPSFIATSKLSADAREIVDELNAKAPKSTLQAWLPESYQEVLQTCVNEDLPFYHYLNADEAAWRSSIVTGCTFDSEEGKVRITFVKRVAPSIAVKLVDLDPSGCLAGQLDDLAFALQDAYFAMRNAPETQRYNADYLYDLTLERSCHIPNNKIAALSAQFAPLRTHMYRLYARFVMPWLKGQLPET